MAINLKNLFRKNREEQQSDPTGQYSGGKRVNTLPFFVFPDSMRRAGHENRQAGWRMRVFRIQTHSSRAGLSNRTWSFYHRSL